LQPGVLGADTGVIQAGADAVRFGDLAVLVLQDQRAVAVQHPARAFLQRGGVLVGLQPLASGFYANQAGVF
jgi:hypothetical protein